MRIAAVTLLLGTLALSACDDDENFILPVIEGNTFVLRTANGQSLPAVISDSGRTRVRVEVVAGTLTLGRNGTFTDEIVFRERRGDAVATRTRLCRGTFITTGNSATFGEASTGGTCGESFTGVIRLGTLTTTIQGIVLVWSQGVIDRRI